MSPRARAALATRHGKGPAFARALSPLGIKVVILDAVDTDAFGTFSGERPRPLSALETARAKAQAALDAGTCALGLASEGTYGPHPEAPALIWGEELALCLDPARGLEIVGRHRGAAPYAWSCRLRERAALEAFRLPTPVPFVATASLGAVPRADLGVRKAQTLPELPAAWEALDRGEGLWLQAELRAHLNPDRMAAVEAAAADLARRLATPCPACRAPGFGPEAPRAGRPCRDCGGPTPLPLILRDACPCCGHEDLRPLALKADPRHCPDCNP